MSVSYTPSFCFECKGSDVIVDFSAGDVICRSCGVILGDRIIDESAEWNNYEGTRISGNRCSGAIASPADAVGIIKGGSESNADHLNGVLKKVNRKCGLVSKYNYLSRIEEISSRLSLSGHIVDIASARLSQLEQDPLFRHKTGDAGTAICAAIVYLACRQGNVSRSFDEISPVVNLDKKDIAKAYKYIGKYIDINFSASGDIRGDHIVPRACSLLGISPDVSQLAKYAAQRCSELSLTDGVKPGIIAAISIWLIVDFCLAQNMNIMNGRGDGQNDEAFSPKQIAEVCSISLLSLQNQYKKIYSYRSHLIPKDFRQRSALVKESAVSLSRA